MQEPNIEELKNQANDGDPDALYTLFKMYKLGWYKEIDNDQAMEMLKKSAALDQAMATMELGKIHFLASEYEQALPYLEKAAGARDTQANMILSEMYRKGLGVEVDEKAAANYCLAAAESGDPNAQYNVGAMYMNGNGVEPDSEKGRDWLTRASNNFLESAIELYNTGQLDKAKERATAALQIFMGLGPSYRGIIRITSLLGAIYGDLGEVEEAKKFLNMALHAANEMEEKDEALISSLEDSLKELLAKTE